MGASSEAQRSDPAERRTAIAPHPKFRTHPPSRRWVKASVGIGGLGMLLWCFPLFHLAPLESRDAGPGGIASTGAKPVSVVAGHFDAARFTRTFWETQLQPAAAHARDARVVLASLRRDPAAAAKEHGTQVGIGGTTYFFVRGVGRITTVEKSRVLVALEGAEDTTVVLRTGPIFGNALRDGPGLLNVNALPGLEQFNAVATELNGLAEAKVIEPARKSLVAGTTVMFAGCAEAPEAIGAGPALTIVPLQLEVRP